MAPSRRRRTILAAAILCACILLVWRWLPERRPASPTAQTAATEAIEAIELQRAASTPARVDDLPRPPPPASLGPAPQAPIIDEITLEKTELCEGEENLVTIRAHTPDGVDDAYLHYSIPGRGTGAQIPVRHYVSDDDETPDPPMKVIAFGRNNVATEVELPPVTIRECRPSHNLFIQHRVTPNTEAELELYARIIDIAAGAPFEPVLFRWSFGDGTTAETDSPVVTHDYGQRPQDTHFSQLLIGCEAVAADGETVRGRLSVELSNPSFEHLNYKGIVTLLVIREPRFPEMDGRGVVAQGFHVWHHHPQPVIIRRVLREDHLANGATRGPRDVPVTPVLGATDIPREGIDVALALDTVADPDTVQQTYTLLGESVDGYPVHGVLTVMRPPPKPTKQNSRPVTDKYLQAKILRAREILGQAYVTDEDILRLEKQGAFDDLRPEDFPEPEPEPEPEPPPGP